MSEKGEIVKTEKGTAEVYINFFGNIVKNLNISQYSDFDPIIENVKDPTLKAILKYKKHPSILAIRTICNRNGVFSFREVSYKEIKTEIRLLKLNKASHYSDIPTKIIKQNFIYESINNPIKSSIFPSCLKHADVTPLHEKSNKSLKENYRPVSILPILSKVFEGSMFKVGLLPSKIICVICLIESPLKMMKKTFYFIVKALFVLKLFKFLSRLFGHIGKTA